ncbi:hypothetical protein X946_5499 [Burkholderia sp. ABCPW 111]|nr:hypothetical protein X946_5499 [Burkholderia sp. ABCPW 111]
MAQVVDAALDLLHPLVADHLRIGAGRRSWSRRGRRCGALRRDHTCRKCRDEGAACRRADQPMHSILLIDDAGTGN